MAFDLPVVRAEESTAAPISSVRPNCRLLGSGKIRFGLTDDIGAAVDSSARTTGRSNAITKSSHK